MMATRYKLAVLGACSLLGNCTVGPDFEKPAPPAATSYTKEPVDAGAPAQGGKKQRFVSDEDIPAAWWTLFHSEALDGLIRQSLKENPDLQSAQAALRIAMENVKAQAGFYYPSVVASAGASRHKDAGQISPVLANSVLLYNLYQTQLSVSWTPDTWGGKKRQVEALQATADAQRFELEATYVALTSNIVAAAVQEAGLREQIRTTEEMIVGQQQVLDIEKRQKALGQISGADVAAQEALVAQTEQALPPLQKQLAQQRDLLTELAGRLPVNEITQKFSLSSLTLPSDLPLSVPSKLVEHRADVRVAEENLHVASAQIGVAIANMLPNFTLSATGGSVATTIGQLFTPGNGFWSLGADFAQPLFDGGTLLHQTRAARAAYDQASSQYRSTVIVAFQNVADVLHAIQADNDMLLTASTTETATSRSLEIARRQVAAGEIARIALLNAQQAYLQARLMVVQARASRFADTAALFQALGGGWWNSSDLTQQASAKETP